MNTKFISNELMKEILECKFDIETTTYTISSSDLMIMQFNNYIKESNSEFKINIITDNSNMQNRKEKTLNIGYVLQLCDDWARYKGYFVINDKNKFRVIQRDNLKLIYEESVANSLRFSLSPFNIFKGYEWILKNLARI